MSGRVGDLSHEQQKILDEAKTILDEDLKKKGKTFGDDYELLRFLRAHKFVVKDMVPAYLSYLEWRETNKVDTILEGKPPRHELLRRIVPSGFHGFDKEGRPCYIEKSGQIHIDTLTANFTDDEIIRAHIWAQENQCRRARESSAKHGRHIETFCSILDLKGLNSSHKKALRFTKAITQMDSVYYPERMGRMCIVNTPWIFNILYPIVRPWLDPVTREKIVVIKGDIKAGLSEYFDLDQLPIEYGGTCKGGMANSCEFHPDCIKVFDLAEAKKGLERDEESMDLLTETIPSGKKFVRKLEGKAGTAFTWYFKTTAGDINFHVEFHPVGGKPIIINNPAKYETAENPVSGAYTSTVDGSLLLTFNNDHAWFKSKTLQYYANATGPVVAVDSPSVGEAKSPTEESKAAPPPAAAPADGGATAAAAPDASADSTPAAAPADAPAASPAAAAAQ